MTSPTSPLALSSPAELRLESLSQGIPVIPEEAAGFYKQNCMVCLHLQNHSSGVVLTASHEKQDSYFAIVWDGEITPRILRSYRDTIKATDFAACAIGLLLIREITSYTAIEQSCIGSTIDYYLVDRGSADDPLIFNDAARLEVSGILQESETNSVSKRIQEKRRRLRREGDLPDIIVVVEFTAPKASVVGA